MVQALEPRVMLSASAPHDHDHDHDHHADESQPVPLAYYEEFAPGVYIEHTTLDASEAADVPSSSSSFGDDGDLLVIPLELNGSGLQFNLIAAGGMSQTAIDGFTAAANLWSSILTDDIIVNININFTALGSGILGSTSSTTQGLSVSSVRTALIADAKSADDLIAIANLPTGSSLSLYTTNPNTLAAMVDNNGTTNNTTLDLTTAQAKALGLRAADSSTSDASISFSTSFTWDFDRSNGITGGAYDFIGVAAHEIGHALGFRSGVDLVDYYSTGGPGGALDLNNFRTATGWDLFRRSSASESNGTDIDIRADTDTKYFSINGGATSITTYSTGKYHGDGRQGSHWKDGLGLGMMDPTASTGEFVDITDFDIQGFDVMGWDVVMDYGDAPDTGTGTAAGNYRTNLSDDGPRHRLFKASGLIADPSGAPKVYLGSGVSSELIAQPNSGATGDSDDGIASFPTLAAGATPNITVTSTGGGAVLNYFFDFNADGDFLDAGEAFSAVLNSTSQAVPVIIPVSANLGTTLARFRISTAGGLTSIGAAADGEVEDYAVTITSGGGGGNAAPTAIAVQNATTSLPENTSTASAIDLGDIVVTDDGQGTNTLSLSGADAASFEIVGTDLRLKAGVALNYETKTSYAVTVNVDDTTVGSTPDASTNFTLTITNFNETPTDIALSGTSVAENQASGTAVGNFSSTDPDAGSTFTYSLVSGTGSTDNASFTIVGSQLRTAASFNYEVKNSYAIRVRSTDQGGLTFEKQFAISVTDVNEAPTAVSLQNTTTSLPENTSTASAINLADIMVTDDALGSENLSLSGTDAASFEIVGTELRLKAGISLNYEAKSSYAVTVNVDDTTVGSTPDASVNFTLTITNVNEAPTDIALSSSSIAENQPVNTTVGTYNSIDPDAGATFTYSLVSGAGSTDNSSFNISGNQLRTSASFNFEVKNSYAIRVRSTDQGGLTFEKQFTVSVTNVNEAPTAVTLQNATTSLPENTSTASAIKLADIVVTDDALGSETLSLSGTDAASFEIVGADLRLKAGVTLNYEAKSSYSVTVNVNDATVGGNPDASTNFTLTITDVNEAPTVALQNSVAAFSEATSTASRIKVADIAVTDDALGTETLTLSGADAAMFEIDGFELFLKAGASLSSIGNPSLDVTVSVDDATVGGTPDATANLSIAVLPASTLVSLDGSGNLVVTDTDGGTSNDTLTITADNTNGKFIIADPTQKMAAPIAGATVSVDAHTIEVPFALVTGGQVIVNTLGGNDSVTVNAVGGAFGKGLSIDGGAGTDTVSIDANVNSGGTAAIALTAETINLDGNLFTDGGDVSLNGGVVLQDSLVTIDTETGGNNNAGNVLLQGTVASTFFDYLWIDAVSIGGGNVTLASEFSTADEVQEVRVTTSGSVNVTGSLHGELDVILIASDVNITGTVTTVGYVWLEPYGTGQQIDLGTNTAGKFSLTDAELDNISTEDGIGTIYVGDTSAGAITQTAQLTQHGKKLQFVSGGSITRTIGDIQAHRLALRAGTNVGTSAVRMVTLVDNLEVAAGAGGLFVTEGDSLTIGDASINHLGLTTTGGPIHLIAGGAITVDEAITANGGGPITLQSYGSDIALGADLTTTADATLVAGGAITRSAGTIAATDLTLNAMTNIGSAANRVYTAATRLEAIAGGAGSFITEADAIEIGGASAAQTGLATRGGNTAVDLIAGGAVTVSEIVKSTGTGLLNLAAQSGNLAINAGLASGSGDMTVSAGGSVFVNAVPGSNSGLIAITAGQNVALAANILVSGNTAAITAGNAITRSAGTIQGQGAALDAGNNIGASNSRVWTQVQNLEARAGSGGMFITEADAATIGGASAALTGLSTTSGNGLINVIVGTAATISEAISAHGTGTVTLQTFGSDIAVGANVTTAGEATLLSGGAITRAAGVVSANQLTLNAQSNIGTAAGRVHINANNLEAVAGGAGMFLAETDAVTIGGIAPNVKGLSTRGGHTAIDLTAGGTVTVGEVVKATGTGALSVVSTGGNVVVNDGMSTNAGQHFLGASGNVQVNVALGSDSGQIVLQAAQDVALAASLFVTNNTAVVSAGNAITRTTGTIQGVGAALEAGNNIGTAAQRVWTKVTNLEARLTGAGGMFITESDAVTIGGASDNFSGVSSTNGGQINLITGNAVTVSEAIAASGATPIVLQTYGGDIALAADVTTAGDATLLAGAAITRTAGTVAADNLTLNAQTHIGTAANRVTTAAARLEAVAGGTGMFLAEADGVEIGNANPNQTGLSTRGGNQTIDLTAGGTVTVSEVVKSTGSGALNLASTCGNVVVNAGMSSMAGALFVSAGGNVAVNMGLGSNSGQIALQAGQDVAIGANLFVTNNTAVVTAGNSITRTTGTIQGVGAALDAGNNIGTAASRVWTQVLNLEARSGGAGGMFITEADAVTIGGASGALTGLSSTGGGTINFISGGALTVGEAVSANGAGPVVMQTYSGPLAIGANITAAGDATLLSGAAITQSAGTIAADNLILLAGTNIGSAIGTARVFTNVNRLEARASNGGIFITETDALELGGIVTNNLVLGLETAGGNGDIEVVAGGTLTITDGVKTHGTGTTRLRTAGDVTQAGGIVTNVLGVVSEGGTINLSAATNDVNVLAAQATAAGQSIYFRDLDDLRVNSVSAGGVFAGTLNGIAAAHDVELLANAALSIEQVILAGGSAGDAVRLQSVNGAVTQTMSGVIQAANLSVQAGTTINLPADNDVDTFAALAGTGPVTFNDPDGFTIGTVAGGALITNSVSGVFP